MDYSIIEANLIARKKEMSDIIKYSDLTNLEKLELATKYNVWDTQISGIDNCFREEEKAYQEKCKSYNDTGVTDTIIDLMSGGGRTYYIDICNRIKELSQEEPIGEYYLNDKEEFLFLESRGDNTPPTYMPVDWIIEKIAEYCVTNEVIGF
jgi:hypothetical protein